MSKTEIGALSVSLSLEANNFSKQISSINKEIKNLDKDFKSAGKGVEGFDKSFQGLSKKMDTLNKKFDLTEKKLNSQEKAYKDLEGTLKRQQKELQEIENTLGKGSKEWEEQAKLVQKNAEKLSKLGTDINSTKGDLTKLSSEIEKTSKSFNGLEKETKSLDENLENIGRQSALTESQLELLDSELQKSGTYFQKLELEVNKVATKLDTGKAKINAYENEMQKLTQQIDKNKSKQSDLSKEIEKTGNELEQAKSEYGENSREARELETSLMKLKDEFRNVSQEIDKTENNFDGLQTELNQTRADVNKLNQELNQTKFDKLGKDMQNVGSNIKDVGQTMTTSLTLPLGAMGGASVKASLDFESAFTGVVKTVDMTTEEMEVMSKAIRDMSKEMPTAATEIAGVAEAAGQLGIERENILGFTKTMVQLGDTTNLSAGEAASAMAQFANVTQMSQKDFDKLGSTIVALGNSTATTEADIVSMASRLAGAGSLVGLSEHQIISFSAALSSVGINAEAGGTAFSKVMSDMMLATEKGGKKLDQFAKVAGMSSKEFKTAFEQDAAGAIMKFIEGLAGAESQGKSAIGILDEMGYKEAGVSQALFKAAGASDKFTEALSTGSTAWEENTALSTEAETRYKTNASQLEILKNRLTDVAVTIGDALVPHFINLAEWLTGVAEKFAGLDEGTQKAILVFGGLVAVAGPVLMVVGQISMGIGTLVGAFGKLTSSAGVTGGSMGKLTKVLGIFSGPVGIGLAVVAIGGLIAKIGDNESALLGLQEKFGGFGVIVSGVCEFISGIWDLTMGNLFLVAKFAMDSIAAVIDGPGGATVKDAWENFNNDTQALNEEAMRKINLTTTQGMSQMRNATDEQLTGTVNSMKTILGAIPGIADGNYKKASEQVGKQLSQMDSTQIKILKGMNDTTAQMFDGIREGMSVDEASKKVQSNLKTMAERGKIDAGQMEKDITKAMEQMKGQMDTKTKEASDKAGKNMKEASDKVGKEADNMAKSAKKGTGEVASNTDADFKKANKSIQQEATNMYNGTKNSYEKLSQVAKQSGTDMYKGVSQSAKKMSESAKSSASDMYRGVTTSTRQMADKAIADWNRVRNAYSRQIKGSVTVSKQTVEKAMPQPQIYDMGSIAETMTNIPRTMDTLDYNSPRYSGDINGKIVSTTQTTKSDNEAIRIGLEQQNRNLEEQNGLLMRMIGLLAQDRQVDLSVQIDGRQVAKATSSYMDNELRKNRDSQVRAKGGR